MIRLQVNSHEAEGIIDTRYEVMAIPSDSLLIYLTDFVYGMCISLNSEHHNNASDR